ncbi:MAG: hypothetical protein JSV10_06875 [Candidatus Zixiibacteriota bacterium]|nr:MAG: hypothetical protein JSV10_06875 [candidate division Zixibacteria bacterium]
MLSILKSVYEVLTISSGYAVGLFLCFLVIDFLFCLLAQKRRCLNHLRGQIRRLGMPRLALGAVLVAAICVNFFTQYEVTLHYWVSISVFSFLIRVTYLGFGGKDLPKQRGSKNNMIGDS